MALETTIFTFKISVPFADWAKGFDSPEVVAMHEANAITVSYTHLTLPTIYSV